MFNRHSLKFLEKFMLCSGPSGFEYKTAKMFCDYIEKYCDEIRSDVMGNAIGIINPGENIRVMLAGHYDEIGFQVVYVSEEGLIHFRKTGGIDNITVPGTEVIIMTDSGNIPGVIGKKPIHLTTPKEREKIMELKDLWIDIGAENKKDAEKLVKVGDPIAVKPNFERMGKYKIKSKGMDDKIGAFVVAETLRNLSKRKLAVSVYGVGTVQEEVGLRGAGISAFGINPHIGFAIDVDFASDVPGIDKKEIGEIKLGKGPTLSRSADNNPVLGKFIREIAKQKKIAYQDEAGRSASGGTDTAQIQITRAGVATAKIGIPNRYMHTPVEMCDLRDVENAIKLLTEAISSLSGKEDFIPLSLALC